MLFTALSDRPKDWLVIATVIDEGAVDRARVREALVGLPGPDDGRVARLEALRPG